MMKDCNNCKHEDCWEYAEPCSSCTTITGEPTNWQPQSNYDRIISKTPEELATLISENIDCGVCENVFGLRPCSERCCPDFWLDWLKREADGVGGWRYGTPKEEV